ncbi:MAG: hypothetical protein ACLR6I_19510 [Waltera sp.]
MRIDSPESGFPDGTQESGTGILQCEKAAAESVRGNGESFALDETDARVYLELDQLKKASECCRERTME